MLCTGCWILSVGYWVLGRPTGCWVLSVGYWALSIGCCVLDVEY